MALKLALILQAVDRMTGPAKRARAGVTQLTKGARDLARSSPAAAKAMDRVSAAAARMPARLKAGAMRLKAMAGRAGMKGLELAARGAGSAIGTLIGKTLRLGGALLQIGAAGASFAGGAFLGGIISTTAKFEQFQIMLEGTEGSAEKAKASMAWVREFAKKTPYELEQVMEAFVQLKAYGIDPMDGALRAAGDAAAGMSKPLMQAIEALADAQTGEFERLKEFGIRARQESGRVVFTYQKDGKEIRREATKNGTAIREAISGIWSDRFSGMMDRQSKTFNGLISNLKDGWTDFMLRVGQAGVFDRVKASAQRVLDWLNARLADGSIDKWAGQISKQLERAFDWAQKFIRETDWQKVGTEVKQVADAVWVLARAIAGVVHWVGRMNDIAGGIDQLSADNKQRMRAGVPVHRQTLKEAVFGRPRKDKPAAAPLNLRGSDGPMSGVKRAIFGKPQKVQTSGVIDVRVRGEGGAQARLAGVQQTGDVPIRASSYRGGAMGRPA